MSGLPSWTAYHGIRDPHLQFSDAPIFQGLESKPEGIHLGSLSQARMRAGKGNIMEVTIHGDMFDRPTIKRVKDRPGSWKNTNNQARREGVSALVYLNRWEGVDNDTLDEILTFGSDRFDRMSDTQARRKFPQLQDSWIILDPGVISVNRTLDHQQVVDLLKGSEHHNDFEAPKP